MLASIIGACLSWLDSNPTSKHVVAGISIPGNTLLYSSPEALETDMDRLDDLHVKWVRFDFIWQDIEPKQGAYDWSRVDRVVKSAKMHGFAVLGILTTIPQWLRPVGTDWRHGPTSTAQRSHFAAFASIAAQRYVKEVRAWEIWNEPNCEQFWAPKPDALDYAALLAPTYSAIKEVSNATVLTGGTCGATSPKDIPTVTWFSELYNKGANHSFDAAAMHPYPDTGNVISGEMAAAATVRALMDKNGDGQKKLWGTEFGTPTGGSDSMTEIGQASSLRSAYAYWASIPNTGPLFTYTLRDTDDGPKREDRFGLLRANGSAKPAFDIFKQLIAGKLKDTSPPNVVLDPPPSEKGVSGVITLGATVIDDHGIAEAALYVDGTRAVAFNEQSNEFTFDTRPYLNGKHTLQVRAYDTGGNMTESTPLLIIVANPVQARDSGPTVQRFELSTLRQRPGQISIAWMMTISSPIAVDQLLVACRDRDGSNCDLGAQGPLILSGQETFEAATKLPLGTYSLHIAYRRGQTWHDLGPYKVVTLRV